MELKDKEINETNKKSYKLSLKQLKNENIKNEKFSKLTDVLMSYHLIPFFKIREAKDLGKLNTKFYNAFVRYYSRICDSYINKYNIKIENEEEYEPNKIYEQKDDKGHFIKLSFFNQEHYLLFSYFNWAWKDNNGYWDKISSKNSLLNKEIYNLKKVCWVDVNANMSHIYCGKYKLYLNHCVCNLDENKLKITIFIDDVLLKEFLYPSKEQIKACRENHSEKKEEDKKEEDKKEEDKKEEEKKDEDKKENKKDIFIKKGNIIRGLCLNLIRPFRPKVSLREIKKALSGNIYNKDNYLYKEYIMDVDIIYDESRDNGNGHEVKVLFGQKDNSWKKGWLIDGVIFESINDMEN